MEAVLRRERDLGYAPVDVSRNNIGYDIESTIPPALRGGGPGLRFIEVKGRRRGATTITVTRNEILTALNKPEEYLLAIVEVDGEHTRTTYLRRPFGAAPDMGACSVNYEIAELMRVSEREE